MRTNIYVFIICINIFCCLIYAQPTQGLVAYYPFNGNANDESGNGNNGTVSGATLTYDRFNNSNKAYYFNGNGNYILFGNGATLQISGDITVCVWVKLLPLSHGQVIINKYLLSVDRGWLIETFSSGIVIFDVRSGIGELKTSGGSFNIFDNNWYFLAGQREGSILKIYVDCNLNSSANSGSTGNMSNAVSMYAGVQSDRPIDPAAFCKGVIDDIRIYNRALSFSEIQQLCNETGVELISDIIPVSYKLYENYPNPFNATTNIKFDLPLKSLTKLSIFDLLGREITTLVNEELQPGSYQVDWDASNISSGTYFYRIAAENNNYSFTKTLKLILIK